MTDYRSRILTAIDRLHEISKPATALEIQFWMGEYGNQRGKLLMRELRKIGRDGVAVYDRKARGWRRV